MSNLDLYNKVRVVPKEAQKPIKGGRLAGKTDINPMWRIQALTEQFGPCGIGWKYTIDNKWLDTGSDKEIVASVQISLFIKNGDAWSEPIPGLGGNMLVTEEKNGIYVDDDCYKKALTDALSVACKALGVGADIYWEQGSKYSNEKPAQQEKYHCEVCGEPFVNMLIKGVKYTAKEVHNKSVEANGRALCADCKKALGTENE